MLNVIRCRSFMIGLLSKKVKIKTYRTIILFVVVVVVYGCETWSVTLREKHRQREKKLFNPQKMQYAYCLVHRSYIFRLYYHTIFREVIPEFLYNSQQ
jgi:uncharacterized membrane protein